MSKPNRVLDSFQRQVFMELRERRMTRSELAERIGRSRQAVSSALNRNTPGSWGTLSEIAEALDLRVSVRSGIHPFDETEAA